VHLKKVGLPSDGHGAKDDVFQLGLIEGRWIWLLKFNINKVRGIAISFELNDGPLICHCFLKGNKSDQSAVSNRI
jgi:hypothetical protein